MGKDIRSALLVAGGYAAAVIGAGFASGQEIVSFFVRYGKWGMAGIIIACIGFSAFSYAVLSVCAERKIYSFKNFVGLIFKGRLLNSAVNGMVFLCAAASMCVMTACAGEIGRMTLNLPEIVGASAFAVACGIILFMEAREVTELNSVLGAVIVTGIIFTCFYILRFREHQTFSPWVRPMVSGLAYAGYNVVGTGAVLAGMSRLLKDKNDALMASVAAGAVLFVLITLLWGVLSIYYGQIDFGEIPMLTMALRQNKALGVFYGIMLAAAVLTTGISNGFALLDIIGRRAGKKRSVFIITLSALALSGAGFGLLVDTVYRYCGYVGAAIAIIIIFKAANGSKMKQNEDI